MYNSRSPLLVWFILLQLLVSSLLGTWVSAIESASGSNPENTGATSTYQTNSILQAPKITITASRPAGRYSGPIRIELTASNPEAKIWYTCRRNGTPADLVRYTEVITLSKSCALVYFGYVTTELESRIERTDYTILYSDAVELETRAKQLSLVNTGDSTADIGGWEVIAGTGAITIPAGTTLLPQARYSIGRVDPASYELRSPEGFTKSTASISPPVRPIQVAAVTPPSAIRSIQTPPAFGVSNPSVSPKESPLTPTVSSVSNWMVAPSKTDISTNLPQSENVSSTPSVISPVQSLKTSTIEATPKNYSWLAIILSICAALILGWFIRRRKEG